MESKRPPSLISPGDVFRRVLVDVLASRVLNAVPVIGTAALTIACMIDPRRG
jgi:hypothetical protein